MTTFARFFGPHLKVWQTIVLLRNHKFKKFYIHCVPKKWRQNRNHNNCDTSYQTRLKYPLSSFNYHFFLVQTFQISTKSTAQFLSTSCLKNRTQKQKFPIWKSRLSSSYTIPSVTVCAQSGRHLHRHLHVSCADRSFSAAAGLPVCRPKSVQCWTRQLSGNSSNNFLAL